jgi:hypothetical protein
VFTIVLGKEYFIPKIGQKNGMACIMQKEWTLELMFGYFSIMMRTMFSSKEEEQQFYYDKLIQAVYQQNQIT